MPKVAPRAATVPCARSADSLDADVIACPSRPCVARRTSRRRRPPVTVGDTLDRRSTAVVAVARGVPATRGRSQGGTAECACTLPRVTRWTRGAPACPPHSRPVYIARLASRPRSLMMHLSPSLMVNMHQSPLRLLASDDLVAKVEGLPR